MPASAVLAVLLVRFFDEAAAYLPAAALESFRADLGLSYAQAGLVLALIAPGALIGNVFSVMADRRSRRAIAAGGAFAVAAALAAFAVGATFPILAAAALGLGAGATAMVDGAEVALVDLAGAGAGAGGALRPFLARGNLLGVVGDLAGPALVALVALLGFSWRASFWTAATLLAGYGLALARAPVPGPRATSTEAEAEADSGSVARDRRVWLLGILSALMAPFDEALLGFTIALLERERGASPAVATAVAMLAVAGGVVVFAGLGRRVSGPQALIGGAVAMTAGALGIAVAPWIPVIAAAAFAVDLGLCLCWLDIQHRTLTVRPGQAGATSAAVSGISWVGYALPIAVGALADRFGLPAAIGLYVVLGVLFTAAAAALVRTCVRALAAG